MFCVKESTDIPRAISTLIENKATHRAFLEIGVGNMLNTVHAQVEGWADVYYIIEIRSVDDFNRYTYLISLYHVTSVGGDDFDNAI